MQIASLLTPLTDTSSLSKSHQPSEADAEQLLTNKTADDDQAVKEAFQDFVGQTFFSQMLNAMRKTVGKPAYFHGGRAEEVFQGQLDQVLAEKLSDASADSFAGPMFELFQLQRR